MRTIVTLIILVVLTGCTRTEGPIKFDSTANSVEDEASQEQSTIDSNATSDVQENVEEVPAEEQEEEIKIPATFDHKVGFAAQAPHGNWDLPYQEACEEASLITASYFFEEKEMTADLMDMEIKKLVEWEKEHLGVYTDTSVEEVVRIAEEYFGLQAWIVDDVSTDRIKKELVKGNLIVAPFAGRMLDNKNFTDPGPIYHMLVIRGYDRNEFVTNDVGTRHGERFKYKYKNILEAMHDLAYDDDEVFRPYDDNTLSDSDKDTKMRTGKQRFIVLSK